MVSYGAALLGVSCTLRVFSLRHEWPTGEMISFTACDTRVANANVANFYVNFKPLLRLW